MSDLNSLQDVLRVRFRNPALLEQALAHSSYINEKPGLESNQRLEFLGDAVLGLVVAEKLYEDFPELEEGDLTKLRAAVVRREALSRIALSIHLGDQILLGKGEEASGGREKPLNLACALEAVVGAVFLDQGEEAARKLVLDLIAEELDQVTNRPPETDYKSQLQEIVQSKQHITPCYRLVEATGPDHLRVFTVQVLAGDMVLGTGSGRSKKLAEMEAARSGVQRISELIL